MLRGNMQAETALTAFCATTVLIIVGLVTLTATELRIADSPLLAGEAIAPPLQLGGCILPLGFELKYMSKRECEYGTINDCSNYCMAGGRDGCVTLSKSRCALIGSKAVFVNRGVYRAAPYSFTPSEKFRSSANY